MTSQTNFDHFIPINENVSEFQDKYLMQLKFYTIGQLTVNVYLAATNDSIEPTVSKYDSGSNFIDRHNYHRYHYGYNPYSYEVTTTTTEAPAITTNAAEGKHEIHKDHIGYQIGKYTFW